MNGATALVPETGLRTYFVLDQATGSVWFHAGHYDNCHILYLRSLEDLESLNFPDNER
jgi:hypothetical protein